jgi:3(or 17)beta-hydroxysteroid dehydrogenase
MGRIDGKVCLVTGGAMGLGKADAIVLAREGGRVVLTDVSKTGENTAAEIGGGVMFLPHDVRDENQWQTVIATTLDRFGRLDVLVNNAGVIRLDTIETATLDDWRFVNAVNVEGTFLGCKHAIPAMRGLPLT